MRVSVRVRVRVLSFYVCMYKYLFIRTVAVNKKLTFRSVSTIVLPFYAIVFAPFVRTRICAFIILTFACTCLIGRRDRAAITIVLRHV